MRHRGGHRTLRRRYGSGPGRRPIGGGLNRIHSRSCGLGTPGGGCCGGCRRRIVMESDSAVGSGPQLPESRQRAGRTALNGVAHLEDETVDLAGRLELAQPRLAEHTPQYAVVAFEQLRKQYAPSRFLDDECSELGNDKPLVRRQILRDGLSQHGRYALKYGSKITFFRIKKQKMSRFFKISKQNVGYTKNIHLLCIPKIQTIRSSYFDQISVM